MKWILAALAFIILLYSGCISPQNTQPKNYTVEVSTGNQDSPNQPSILIKLNCTDGTENGRCSEYKPYFCKNGDLRYDPQNCGCYDFQLLVEGRCVNGKSCEDGTAHYACSAVQPKYCYDGTLLNNSQKCGCPAKYIPEGNGCRVKTNCDDGTSDGACAAKQPLYCQKGDLVQKASVCGCQEGYSKNLDQCINPYPPDITKTYYWKYHSSDFSLSLGFNNSLLKYFSGLSRTYLCRGPCPTDWETEYYKRYVFDEKQTILINDIITPISGSTSDEQLLRLIAFAQSIPYDYSGAASGTNQQKYPYETVHLYTGVCSDNTLLGAAIASKLGYGVALFSYKDENHMALAIKCPRTASNYNSGYCFIEMTANCSRLTYNQGTYAGGVVLKSTPSVIVMSEGAELDLETVMDSMGEVQTFLDAKAKIAHLFELMKSTKDTDTFNAYVEEYNHYVKVYNAFNSCN